MLLLAFVSWIRLRNLVAAGAQAASKNRYLTASPFQRLNMANFSAFPKIPNYKLN